MVNAHKPDKTDNDSTIVASNIVNQSVPISADKGTYILILNLMESASIQIGGLGLINFKSGCYAYVGSAFGPGGLRGRLNHHLRVSTNPHWHIDYLRQQAVLMEIWLQATPERAEHQWAKLLGQFTDTPVFIPKFGSSDCHCQSHLAHFENQPSFEDFQRLVGLAGPSLMNIRLN